MTSHFNYHFSALLSILISILFSCCWSTRAYPVFASAFQNHTPFVFYNHIQQQRPVASALQQQMRAWTCHGRTQRQLVDNLSTAGIIKSQMVKDVMKSVDRANYVLAGNHGSAYDDTPLGIGHGQTISAPHMHAHVLEELINPLIEQTKERPNEALSILDVGFGSGYLTTCFGRLVSLLDETKNPGTPRGKVWGIEYVSDLVDLAKYNTKKQDIDLLESGLVELRKGNGWEGLPEAAPFHAIHVGAAADAFPKKLMMQLAVGGVMVIPIGPQFGGQALYRIERVKGTWPTSKYDQSDFVMTQLLGVRYVPLVHGNYKDLHP